LSETQPNFDLGIESKGLALEQPLDILRSPNSDYPFAIRSTYHDDPYHDESQNYDHRCNSDSLSTLCEDIKQEW